MAELNLGKGLTAGKVASNVQKKLTRAQEKVRYRGDVFRGPRKRRRWRSVPHPSSSRRSVAASPQHHHEGEKKQGIDAVRGGCPLLMHAS